MAQCENCSQSFEITNEDLAFYAKIDVPKPTWCPPCREIRRMAWCNEGVLYPDTCASCKKQTVSQFNPKNPRTRYCVQCWWSDKYNSTDYGQDFDFNKTFAEQFHELDLKIPHPTVSTEMDENCEYTHHAGRNKNCYFIFHATYNEDCMYGYGVKKDKDCIDIHNAFESTLCYECVDIENCYDLGWAQDCFNCGSSRFLQDCIGCTDCFMCIGLRNKKFCFLNKQLTQEEYKEKLSTINTGSHIQMTKLWQQYIKLLKTFGFRHLQNTMVENGSGDHLIKAKNAFYCFDCNNIEESKFISQVQLGTKYCYDMYQFGNNMELCYEGAMVGSDVYKVLFGILCIGKTSNVTYCINTYNNSSNCFGCIGLKKNKFCILNKQYSEEEYNSLVPKIIQHMKQTNEYGEFFSPSLSHTAYNETMAQLWYPMTKQQVLEKGWNWEDDLPGTYGKETTEIENLPDTIQKISDDIIDEVLACSHCKKNYKITAKELKFYKKNHYPLPRYCFNCRRSARMQLRNPRKFWQRICDQNNCQNQFYSTYSPKGWERVYCDGCYKKEVY
ncbi:hypothetical protein HOG48_05265 [Candidatus Peregrinibacteria bacterium]|jgi:hypothetical protein|nr:hypothetical protein [Candidatus Peregrinibacteria bacterium]